jgi:hypothetical protein
LVIVLLIKEILWVKDIENKYSIRLLTNTNYKNTCKKS